MMRHEEALRLSARSPTPPLAAEHYRDVILALILLAAIIAQAPVYSLRALAPLLRTTLRSIPAGGLAERFSTRALLIEA
jgi:hypothetical protein